MKKILKPLFLFATIAFSSFTLDAQNKPLKLAYTNIEEILYQMPESKQVESDLKTYRGQLETQLQQKMGEYEEKYKAYEAGKTMLATSVRTMKEQELQGLQEQIQNFQRDAELDLQKKQNELLEPVITKIKKAIDEVSNEQGYSWVFDTNSGFGQSSLIKMPKEDDITNSVLKKLGITPVVKPAAATSPVVKPAPGK